MVVIDGMRGQAEECGCPAGRSMSQPSHWTTKFHADEQDTESDAWRCLLESIDEAAADGRAEFDPFEDLGPAMWKQIVVLPRTIAKLKDVKRLMLYGSNLRSIPPEIGLMESLEDFDPYTSSRLHWFPYELTQCADLRDSRVSTRVLYGNFKSRPTFPRLPAEAPADSVPSTCSVCSAELSASDALYQRWISVRVATDVLPLLVHACSSACLEALPAPASGYVDRAHLGGTELSQPPPG